MSSLNMSNLNIGITGASGFVGSYLLGFLAKRGYSLRALTRTLQSYGATKYPNVAWMKGDLHSVSDCINFVENLDVVIHLAHTNSLTTSNKHLPSDGSLNLISTLNLLQVIKECGRKPHIIYASSGGAIYKPSPEQQPYKESDLCEPTSSYGIMKLTSEHYLRMGVEQNWFTATSLRISNPYGVLLPSERTQGFIGVALNQIINRRPVKVYGNSENVRDYIHLEDMCRVFEILIQPRSTFDVYNVGSGLGHSVKQILELLEEIIGAPIIQERSHPLGVDISSMPLWNVLDIAKAGDKLEWQPSIELRDGLKLMYNQVLKAE